jgi:murein DD-endopeptidase MepM/ murein hydrolase activator NlpD
MKKILFILLIILIGYIIFALRFLNKKDFICPIYYKWDFIIRADNRGEGFFSAKRNGRRMHQGIDLSAPLGEPVLASRTGWVTAAREINGMGKYVFIRHPQGITTLYGHLSEINVKEGQFVLQGQIIGKVGKTGNAN